MSPSQFERDLEVLSKTTSTTESLIRAFQTSPSTGPSPDIGLPPHPNALAVLSDACKILKAQTTKLSLILIMKPFTPSEITPILSALNKGCLPALASTLDLCRGEKYTEFTRRFINSCLATIWVKLPVLLSSIPRTIENIEKTGIGKTLKTPEDLERSGLGGILKSTGTLWATCDKLVRLAVEGVVPLAMEAAKDHHALLQDAIDEIDAWDPEDDSDDEDDSEGEGNSKPIIATPTTSDDESLLDGVQHLNLNPIITWKAKALKLVRLVRLLYPALNKHRIKTFPNITSSTAEEDLPSASNTQLFDDIIKATKSFTEATDELAAALYSGDTEQVNRRLMLLLAKANLCAESSQESYDGKRDEYSEWAQKWIERCAEIIGW